MYLILMFVNLIMIYILGKKGREKILFNKYKYINSKWF